MTVSRKIRIGDWTLDSSLNRISGPSGTVVLTPLAARVLEYLAEHPGEVLGADELVENLWQRRMVGDAPVYRVIADLRQALRDDAKRPQYIQTVRKRGYRLLAQVEQLDSPDAKLPAQRTTATADTSILGELQRRNVFRVAIAYLAVAWLVMQVVDLVLDAVSAPAWVMQVFLLAIAVGFPIALTIAWAYELTPEGIKLDKDTGSSRPSWQQTGGKLNRVIITALIAAVAFLLVDKFLLRTDVRDGDTVAAADNTVAVMPFAVMSDGRDDDYFGESISEVLIHQLTQIPGLKVTARTSSFAYEGKNIDARLIGSQLGVAAILEGSVQRSDGQVRVSAQLIDTKTGLHLWSQQFDRPDEDIFAIQDDIAGHVSRMLSDSLQSGDAESGRTEIGTENLEAYDEYLKGLEQLRIASFESLPRAIEYFERAIALDDGYNEARLKLIETYNAQNYILQIDYAELAVRNQTIPREILARNPNSARAMNYLAKADFSLHFPTGSGEAKRLWTKALDIAPRDPVILWNYAYYLAWNDRPNEAVAALEDALAVDPYSPRVLASAARQGYPEHAAKLRQFHPDNPQGWAIAGELQLREGDLPGSLQYFLAAEGKSPRNPEFPSMAAIILMTVGLLDEAEAAVERARSKGLSHSATIAASIALTYRRHGLDAAGELALNALRNQLPPYQFSTIVTQMLALRYALKSSQPLEFVDALAQYRDSPGLSGRTDLRAAEFTAPTTFSSSLLTIPAFRAAGETDVADALLDHAREYFADASEELRYHETEYFFQLMEGDVDGALDILEAILESPRSGFLRNAMANPSEYRWWLEFEGELAAPLADDPRYHSILARRAEHIAQEREEILELLAGEGSASQPE
ncbi:MAG: winged helix-turn-helix domain-containing protein [Woeseiaceae bacterium]|nr:winged helix-turn-helix domain-containing protein [Woeseiaceae bacterium]